MEPSTLQCAVTPALAGFQTGALSVTAPTGSPIKEVAMLTPSFFTVQFVWVIVRVWAEVNADNNATQHSNLMFIQ